MICEKCGKKFDEDWRKDKQTIKKTPICRFCSMGCAHSRIHTEESRLKISISAKNSDKVKEASRNRELSEKTKAGVIAWRKKKEAELLTEDFNNLKYDRIKKRILIEQNNKCNLCCIYDWNEKEISLELEHKDGNSLNNIRENLECLCPNCHSQTPTFRGRNISGKTKIKITNDELIDAVIETGNIRKALLSVGMAAKGANYGRVKGALTERGIEYKGLVQ